MFKDWENFYLLLGGAAGSLIGLLFIVVTLTAGRDREQVQRAGAIYMTPLVFHLAVVLVLSAAAMAPRLSAEAGGGLIGLAGLIGLVYLGWVCIRFGKLELSEAPHWSDFWWYAVAPVPGYVCLCASAAAVWLARPMAAWVAAAALMVLLLVAIRNAWDLVTWMAPTAKPQ
jgi:cytochrome bd-type quinol oxidase subunit 2